MTATLPARQKLSPPKLLRDRPELWAWPLPPAAAERLLEDVRQSAGDRLVVATWNRLGGFLGVLCAELGFEPGLAVAVLCAESSGRAFSPDGRLVIRFEVHVFWKLWAAKVAANSQAFQRHFRFDARRKWQRHEFCLADGSDWLPVHQSQATEWQAVDLARGLDDTAALCSASMGGPQLMGFHHQRIGYSRVQEMFAAFGHPEQGERAQILGLFDFLRGPEGDSALLQALARADTTAFARLYNGPGQAEVYAERIARFEQIFRRLRDQGPRKA